MSMCLVYHKPIQQFEDTFGVNCDFSAVNGPRGITSRSRTPRLGVWIRAVCIALSFAGSGSKRPGIFFIFLIEQVAISAPKAKLVYAVVEKLSFPSYCVCFENKIQF